MVTRYTQFAPGEYYHIYNRGVEKRTICMDAADYTRFQELLYLSNSCDAVNVRDIKKVCDSVYEHEKDKPLVAIGAYCLMANHFHILLTPLTEGGVGQFMNKLGTSYTMYFNRRYERTGRLFEASYRAKHVADDTYLRYLYSYIHLNPVRSKHDLYAQANARDVLQDACAYRYASTIDYALPEIKREEECILAPGHFPNYFSEVPHARDLAEWLLYEHEE